MLNCNLCIPLLYPLTGLCFAHLFDRFSKERKLMCTVAAPYNPSSNTFFDTCLKSVKDKMCRMTLSEIHVV